MPVRWMITLADTTASAVDAAAERTGIPRSELIQACIDAYGPDVFQPEMTTPERLAAVMLACMEQLLPYLRTPRTGP